VQASAWNQFEIDLLLMHRDAVTRANHPMQPTLGGDDVGITGRPVPLKSRNRLTSCRRLLQRRAVPGTWKEDAQGTLSPLATSDRQPCVAVTKTCSASAASQRNTQVSASSQMKEVRRALSRRGYVITKTSGGHWRIDHPGMTGPVFAADTPSDHRGVRNLMALLRRRMNAANDA
jgi:hypothetical protein